MAGGIIPALAQMVFGLLADFGFSRWAERHSLNSASIWLVIFCQPGASTCSSPMGVCRMKSRLSMMRYSAGQ